MSEGPYSGWKTMADGSRLPMTSDEAKALWEASEAAQAKLAADMPTEQDALREMSRAHQRLRDFGWRDIMYCPKDGSMFDAIEGGSTGIHRCNYQGEWPNGSWWIYDGDVWPARPILFRLDPEAEKSRREKMAAAAAKFRAEDEAAGQHEWIERFNLTCCAKCGFVRRADDTNKPCQGYVKVGPRSADNGGSA